MLGRIVKFRRGDQYEEMGGRDVASGTAAARPTPNRQPDATGDSTAAAPRDTTPEGTSF